jgi:hypothetical protein
VIGGAKRQVVLGMIAMAGCTDLLQTVYHFNLGQTTDRSAAYQTSRLAKKKMKKKIEMLLCL